MNEYVSRNYLLGEYDRQHQGPPGGARKIIAEAPAADVVKVVRGKWEMNSNYPDRLICSECGAQFDCWHWEAKQMHYCPSCGAKMDGGQDE